MDKITIKGKREAPNGMYWGNITIAPNAYKLVMVEPLNNETYRAWTNNSIIIGSTGWTISKTRNGWAFKDMPIDEFIIFDW